MKTDLKYIDETLVEKILNARDAIRSAAQAFELHDSSRVVMPSKVYLNVPRGDFRAMPSYAALGGGLAGLKWISVFPDNIHKGLPIVIGTLLLNDAKTGRCLAVMGANTLTAWRTGAAGALASKFLAPKGSKKLALVGAGVQAGFQLKCHEALFRLDEVKVWSVFAGQAKQFARRFSKSGLKVTSVKRIEDCVADADIICTCTPAREALIRRTHIQKGVHINAIGADAKGKRELATDLVKAARLVVDDWEQASHSGEINIPVSEGRITRRDVEATLGEVVRGQKRVRRRPSDITLFDSTGLALQDLILARHVYQKALKRLS